MQYCTGSVSPLAVSPRATRKVRESPSPFALVLYYSPPNQSTEHPSFHRGGQQRGSRATMAYVERGNPISEGIVQFLRSVLGIAYLSSVLWVRLPVRSVNRFVWLLWSYSCRCRASWACNPIDSDPREADTACWHLYFQMHRWSPGRIIEWMSAPCFSSQADVFFLNDQLFSYHRKSSVNSVGNPS